MAWNNLPKKQLLYNVDNGAASATDVSTTDSWITAIWVSNHSGSARTVAFVDKASTPRTLLTVSVTDGQVWHTEKKLETALFAEGGLEITPSGNNVMVQILGRQAG